MKRILFRLMTLVALVVLANTTFAQSTPRNPYQGATETYSVTLGASYDYEFLITSSSVTEVPSSWIADTTAAGSAFTWKSTATGTSATPSVDIQWDVASGTYHLWIRAETSLGCFSYRYVQIDPQANDWDVQIFAIAVADTTSLPTSTATIAENLSDSTDYCAVIDPNTNEYLDTTGVTPAVSDGSTWIYYRIVRSNATDVDYDWNFYINLTANSVQLQGSYDYSAWTDISEGTIAVDVSTAGMSDKDIYYIRAEYNASTTAQTITAIIDSGSDPDEATSGLTDSDSATNDVTVTINPIPDMGSGFDGF